MELCDICGSAAPVIYKTGEHTVCEVCKDKIENGYMAMKCLSCGAYGFMPVTKENINKILFFMPLTTAEITQGNLVVVWPDCPSCGGVEKRKKVISQCLHS
jgi:hypothetical protein